MITPDIWADALTGNGTTPSNWAWGELTEAVNVGTTYGRNATRPRGGATREDVAVMCLRTLNMNPARTALDGLGLDFEGVTE